MFVDFIEYACTVLRFVGDEHGFVNRKAIRKYSVKTRCCDLGGHVMLQGEACLGCMPRASMT